MTWFKVWRTRLALLLAVVGPGFITANVDNDAGGIFTYSQAGAQFGYTLLWTMIPITIALVVVQEMAARMGAVTGKGLSDLIREEFGFRVTFFVMLTLVITNFGNVVAESDRAVRLARRRPRPNSPYHGAPGHRSLPRGEHLRRDADRNSPGWHKCDCNLAGHDQEPRDRVAG